MTEIGLLSDERELMYGESDLVTKGATMLWGAEKFQRIDLSHGDFAFEAIVCCAYLHKHGCRTQASHARGGLAWTAGGY